MWEYRRNVAIGGEGEKEIGVREVILIYWVVSSGFECGIYAEWGIQNILRGKGFTYLGC